LETINQALKRYGGNQALAEMILNKGGLTTLNLSEIGDDKMDTLSKILKKNSTLESLSLSGEIYDFSGLVRALTANKNLALKALDLSQCICKDKVSRYDFPDLVELLETQKNLTIALSKDALEDVSEKMVELNPEVKGRLIIKE